jgi:hypothetical protein
MSLALPAYSSAEIMREKVLYAINTCREIDADYQVSEEFNDVYDEKDEYSMESESDTM